MNRWVNQNIVYNSALLLRREWFYPYLKYLEMSQWQTLESIREKQEKRLAVLCGVAKRNSHYYKKILPDSITLESLHEVPFLDKHLLREKSLDLRANCSKFDRAKTTGGSTGAAVTIYKNPRAMAEELAATWRGYNWAGVNVGDRQGRFWGVPSSLQDRLRIQLIDFICNRIRISAFARTQDDWKLAYRALKSFKPTYFYGYASIIKEFANFMLGFEHELKPNSIISTSEVLTNPDRELIENVFSCRVYNEYGCGEVGTIAHECEHGRLHINAENLIVEVIDEKGTLVSSCQDGELVVTDLSNLAMPLIRYRMADWGVISNEACPCGRNLPILKHVFGRAYDSLINNSGKKFHGEFFLYIIEDANKKGLKVDGVQFLQFKNNSITVKLICSDNVYNNLTNFIKDRLVINFDNNIEITFIKVDQIKREPSGKLRVVKRIV